jgi:membrane protein required for colicin V production
MSPAGFSITDFNLFDWGLVLIILFSMLLAFKRGLVRAVISVAGFILGFALAAWDYEDVGTWMSSSRLNLTVAMARVIAFILIVAVVAGCAEMGGYFIQRLVRWVGLGWFDRILGAVFGFARGCLIGLTLLLFTTTLAPQSQIVTRSVLTPYLFAVLHDVSFLVPQYLQQLMVTGAIDFKRGAPRWMNGR